MPSLLRFEQLLRSLILKYTEHIEITLRTFIIRAMTDPPKSTGFEYLDPENFVDKEKHTEFLEKLNFTIEKSDELYAFHYRTFYNSQLPIWVAIELLSFGSLSRFYFNLNSRYKNLIASYYIHNIPPRRLDSYLRCSTFLRNKCAHFSRIYFREFNENILNKNWYSQNNVKNNLLYKEFLIFKELCVDENVGNTVLPELEALFDNYENVIDLKHIGFPSDWKSRLETKKHIHT